MAHKKLLFPEEIIQKLGLTPHPEEGGFYRETYRSEEKIFQSNLPERYQQNKNFSTAIYYLLTPKTYSHFHLLASDEIFHFYYGDPIEMVQLYPDGTGKILILGNDLEKDEIPQVVVPKGVWQGSRLKAGGQVALVGATVAPGFDFVDYRHGIRKSLIAAYPNFLNYIIELTED